MVPYMFRNDPNITEHFLPGTIIVAGHNFGCGSSREQAAGVLHESGVGAVIAMSFARIFYRNCINLGLPVIECECTSQIANLDTLRVDLDASVICNMTQNTQYQIRPFAEFVRDILDAGGIAALMASEGNDGNLEPGVSPNTSSG